MVTPWAVCRQSLVGFCSLSLPEEMTTSLLGVTTFWPLSRSFDVRDVSLWLFHWQFSSLGLFAWCPIFTYVFVSLWERCPSNRVPITLGSVVIYFVIFKGFCVLYFSRVHYYSVLGGVCVKCGVHPSTPFPDLAVSVIYVPHPHHDCLKVSFNIICFGT